VVECFLAKEDVAGSTPVSRSNNLLLRLAMAVESTQYTACPAPEMLCCATRSTGARYPSGKGEVCKTFMRRFDPDPRLHNFNGYERFDTFQHSPVREIVGHYSQPMILVVVRTHVRCLAVYAKTSVTNLKSSEGSSVSPFAHLLIFLLGYLGSEDGVTAGFTILLVSPPFGVAWAVCSSHNLVHPRPHGAGFLTQAAHRQ
jgi:hypothetical protein